MAADLDRPIFSREHISYMLFLEGLDPGDFSAENLRRIGFESTFSQRDRVLQAYETLSNVDDIFGALGGDVPKSSIRSYLCVADPNGPWRQRKRRSTSRKAA